MGVEGVIWFTHPNPIHHGKMSGQELKAGVDAGATEGCCLLSCSLWLPQPALREPRTTFTIHNGLGPSTSIVNQDSVFTDLAIGQSDGGNTLVEIPSSQGCLGLCQVDKN